MKKRNLLSGAALLLAGGLVFGAAACSSNNSGSDSTDKESGGDAVAACESVKVDLETARQAVEDALADDPSWAQVMLAPDVTGPTEKYGLLVMPFVASDAADRVQGTVEIKGGKYTIEADTTDGVTCVIDQDSKITEAS